MNRVKEEASEEFDIILPVADYDSPAQSEEEKEEIEKDEEYKQEEEEDIDPNCTQFNIKEEPGTDVSTLLPDNFVSHKGEKVSDESSKPRRKQLKRKVNTHQPSKVRLNQFKRRARTVAPKGNIFDCDECDRTFETFKKLRYHQNRVHDEREVKCEVCGKVCQNLHALRNHHRVHTKVECSICHKMTPKCRMPRHLQTHSAEKDFDCDLCKYSANGKDLFRRHIERSHLLKNLVRDSKRDDFTNFELLERLQLRYTKPTAPTERKHKCDQCEKAFATVKGLKDHKRRHTENYKQVYVKEEADVNVSSLPHNPVLNHKGKKLTAHESWKLRQKQLKPTTFCCDKCGKSFLSLSNLKSHQRGIHDGKKVKCEVCGKICKNQFTLRYHRRIHVKVECSICKTKVTKCTLPRHLRLHSANYIFECDLCEYSSHRKDLFRRHIEKSHLLKTLVSDSKREDFTNFELLGKLQLRYTAPTAPTVRKFKCDQCENSFSSPIGLKSHKSRFHVEKLFQCPFCEKAFRTKHELTRHTMQVHKLRYTSGAAHSSFHPCTHCQLVCEFQSDLTRHLMSCRKANPTRFECDLCGEIVRLKWRLREHMTKHSSEKRWNCIKCGVGFTSKQGWLIHSRSKVVYKCRDCNVRFFCKPLLDRHRNELHGEKFKCNKCSFQAESEQILTSHTKSHDKTIACETCTRNFSRPRSLEFHQKQHRHGIYATAPEVTFACEKCDESFSTPNTLRVHQRQVHEQKEVKCDVCGKIYRNRQTWRDHRRIHFKVECSICSKMISKHTKAFHMRTHSTKAKGNVQCDRSNKPKRNFEKMQPGINDKPNQMRAAPQPENLDLKLTHAEAQEEPKMEHFIVLKPKWVKSVTTAKFDAKWSCKSTLFETFLTCPHCQLVVKVEKELVRHMKACSETHMKARQNQMNQIAMAPELFLVKCEKTCYGPEIFKEH